MQFEWICLFRNLTYFAEIQKTPSIDKANNEIDELCRYPLYKAIKKKANEFMKDDFHSDEDI